MLIKSLTITNIRIIKSANIVFDPKFNIFIGDNASGKSSLLEALTLLATGRSFRTNNFSEVINRAEEKAFVVAKVDENMIGVERNKHTKKIKIHINQQTQFKQKSLSDYLVVQTITTKVSDLIESSPSARRKFIDWGLFHMKQSTKQDLFKFKKILKYRNALLKNPNLSQKDIAVWDKQFCLFGEKLTELRKEYLKKILERFNKKYATFVGDIKIDFEFYQGWRTDKCLLKTLKENFFRDKKSKSTKNGPHLLDFRIMVDKQTAKNFLSKGQLKTLSFLLRIAQLDLFCQQTNKKPTVLVDDIGAEIDKKNREIILGCLLQLNTQVILTSIENINIKRPAKKFHVKQGEISEILNEI